MEIHPDTPLQLLPLPLLQGCPALLGFEPLLLQPPPALLELLLPQCLGGKNV